MSFCNRCKIKINDPTNVCPLCRCAVKKDGTESIHYPQVGIKLKKMQVALRIYMAAAVVLQAVCFYLNTKVLPDVRWSWLSLATLIAAYIIMRVSVSNRTGYRSRTIGVTIFATAYIILVDYELGFMGWSVNYVLPCSIILLNIAVLTIIFVNLRNWQSYLMVELFLVLSNIVPLLLVLFDITTKPFLSYLAFWISLGMFVCTVIVGGHKAIAELRRRFHI